MQKAVSRLYYPPQDRGLFISVNIADIHFGASRLDAREEYLILKEQFIDKIANIIKLDAIFIAGDLFDRKVMANSDVVYYASLFIDNIVNIAIAKQATVILLKGTDSHDADQLKLFYHYMEDSRVDFRVIDSICFQFVHNARILFIPELYNVDESIYDSVFKYSGYYDQCIFHGTVKGSVYGDKTIASARLLTIEDFANCAGPIIGGHIHTGGCFDSHIYYTGSALRYKFDEENPKGFLICVQDLDSRYYNIHLEEIKSFRYDTINVDDIITSDPKDVINYIDRLKQEQGIDNIRILITKEVPDDFITILNSYYKNKRDIKLKFTYDKRVKVVEQNKKELESISQYDFILDSKLTEYEKLVRYINIYKGEEYITVERLKNILEEGI